MSEEKEVKKVSLADAAKRLLEQKKQAQSGGKNNQKHHNTNVQSMKSQITMKPTTGSRKIGGS